PEYELTLIDRSRGLRLVGDSIAAYREGDLVLLGPNLPHCWISDAGAKGGARTVVLQFRRDCLGEMFFDKPEFDGVRRLFARARRGIQFHADGNAACADELHRLTRDRGASRIVRMLAVLHRLVLRRDVTLLSSPGFQPAIDEQVVSRMDRVHRYLVEHLDREIRLAAVARLLGMSEPAFCRYFKRHAGKPLMRFVNELRIGNACRLLMDEDKSVAEACYGSGYNNLTHFNRQFSKLMGVSPREYRRDYADAARA
ncbi:MAG TPA: AraC family transcriptional regulator, partial [Polyangiaceae bacterium]|nr:AraC family transcriptional regulator [Polyangiaceae bacterium]